MANDWHGRPTKFREGDIITHHNNPGTVCLVKTSTTAVIQGIMGLIRVHIQDDPDWKKLN